MQDYAPQIPAYREVTVAINCYLLIRLLFANVPSLKPGDTNQRKNYQVVHNHKSLGTTALANVDFVEVLQSQNIECL